MNKKNEERKKPPAPAKEEGMPGAQDDDSGEFVDWDEETTWPGGEQEE